MEGGREDGREGGRMGRRRGEGGRGRGREGGREGGRVRHKEDFGTTEDLVRVNDPIVKHSIQVKGHIICGGEEDGCTHAHTK